MKRTATTITALRTRRQYSYFYLALALMTALPCAAKAQTGTAGTVRMSGQVSGMVALSLASGAQMPSDQVQMTSTNTDGRTLAVSLSGSRRSSMTQIEIPIQIRSNVDYALSASLKTNGATPARLFVAGARPTGRFVTANAVDGLSVAEAFDGRSGLGGLQFANRNPEFLSSPFNLFSGPRISRAGTLSSPDNAVEVILSIAVMPTIEEGSWTAELIISA